MLDRFGRQIIIGLKVRTEQRCRRCGNDVMVIGPPSGAHAGRLDCFECLARTEGDPFEVGAFVGWLKRIDAGCARQKSARLGWNPEEVIDCRPVVDGPPPIDPDDPGPDPSEYFDPSEFEDDDR
jgi:hypothetical protein